jgi:hypothetical protein
MRGIKEEKENYPDLSPPPSSPPTRDCVVIGGNGKKCHAELGSASNGINKLRDPETSSG